MFGPRVYRAIRCRAANVAHMTFLHCGVLATPNVRILPVANSYDPGHNCFTHRLYFFLFRNHTCRDRPKNASSYCMNIPFRFLQRSPCTYSSKVHHHHLHSLSLNPHRLFTMARSTSTIDVSPPTARWMKDTLDRSVFHRTIPVLAARVAPAKAGIILKADVMRR